MDEDDFEIPCVLYRLRDAEDAAGSRTEAVGGDVDREPIALTAEEKSQLFHATSRPRAPWAVPPLLPGSWTELEGRDAAALLALVSQSIRLGAARTPLALAVNADRVRFRDLACYPDGMVVEMQGYGVGGLAGTASLIVHPDLIRGGEAGTSAAIFDTNDRYPPALETAEGRRDYMLLFMNWVRAEEGRFQPLETGAEIRHRVEAPEDLAKAVSLARPITEAGGLADGGWRFDMRLVYGVGIFDAGLTLSPRGEVEMVEDEPLADGLTLRGEVFEGALMRLGPVLPVNSSER